MTDRRDSNPDHLDKDHFDVVLSGTGFEHCLLAGALASAGKTVLHVDQHDYYGDDSATIPWPQVIQALKSYDNVAVVGGESLNSKYLIDLQPGLLFSRSRLVDDIIRSGTHHYLTFRAINSHYTMIDDQIVPVPISRSAIFHCTYLSRPDKRRLMKLIHLVMNNDRLGEAPSNTADHHLLDSHMDQPFSAYLDQLQLSSVAKEIIIYSLCLSDSPSMSTSTAIENLKKFVNSLGRFDAGALLYPQYGTGDFPQAFARFAAVCGATYLLRTTAMTFDQENLVRLSTSQQIGCKTFFGRASSDGDDDKRQNRLSRCVCISKEPIQGTDSLSLIVLPPNKVFRYPIKILQVDEGTGCVPKGSFMLHLSALQAENPESDLSAALNTLVAVENRLATIFFTDSQRSASDTAGEHVRHIDVGHGDFGFDLDKKAERVRSVFNELCPGVIFLHRDDGEDTAVDLDRVHNPEFDSILSNTSSLSV